MTDRVTTEDEYMTAREAADLLRLKPWSVYAKAASGELVAYCIGRTRSMRFLKADVIALLRRRAPSSNAEFATGR
jgi:excisionase family DNA binding protein